MKKSTKILLACICLAVVAAVVVLVVTLYPKPPYEPGQWFAEGDDSVAEMDFETELNNISVMENTWETALPQTVVYNLIQSHFSSALPEGKTEKKAIVIGYDGCLADTFRLLETSKRSAINLLLQNGGHAIFTYAGGANYPQELLQKTSTAPGWCSMLTGVLSDVHGVTGNDTPKGVEPKSLLLRLVENGDADASAMYVSWKKHFSTKNATYLAEKDYAEANGIPAVYLRAENDAGTKQNILDDLAKADCSDFIFSTHEYTDHAGHGSGFSLQNIEYVDGFRNAEAAGVDIIEAIEKRPTYSQEDWLILITTDHGGIKKDHGGESFEERITFIVSNKEIPLSAEEIHKQTDQSPDESTTFSARGAEDKMEGETMTVYSSNKIPYGAMRMIAHTGYSAVAPGNTLPAYHAAGKSDFWGAECDIQRTKDGVWVLMHDDTVDRTTDGTGTVKEMTYAQIKDLTIDSGNNLEQYPNTKVPTLTEYLDVCKQYGLHPVIEIKPNADVETLDELAALLSEREEREMFVVICFNRAVCLRIKELMPETPVYLLISDQDVSQEDIDFAAQNHLDGMDIHVFLPDDYVKAVIAAGLDVIVWTIDDLGNAERFYELGVTAITSNALTQEKPGA